MTLKPFVLALAAFAVSACASNSSTSESTSIVGSSARETSTAVRTAGQNTAQGVSAAATAPLDDLNIRREELPEVLEAIEYVYETEPGLDCARIERLIAALDEPLGQDYDAEADEDGRSMGQRGGEAASDALLGAVRGATTGFIPARGLVREATGAARHARRVARAYTAGNARRAYLKGLGAGLGCASPAAPRVLTMPDEDSEETRQSDRWGAPSSASRN